MPTDLMMRLPPKIVPSEMAAEQITIIHSGKPLESGMELPNEKRNAQHGDRHEFLTILSAVQEGKRHRCNVLNDGEKLIGRLALHEFKKSTR